MTTPATGAPPTPAAAPPAPPAPPPAAPPAPPASTSLIDPNAAPPAVPPAAPPAAPPPTPDPEWFYANGVKGAGPVPDWYKASKYKTVDEQAKAYPELEKRLGAFTGAPKDGNYTFKMPEGIEGELDTTSPQFVAFKQWATDNQLSQDGYQKMLEMYVENIVAQQPDPAAMKAALGEKADERLGAVNAWVKANVPAEAQAKFKAATSGVNAVEVFEAIEAVINKTRQVAPPKPGDDTPAGGPPPASAVLAAERAKLAPNGKVLYFEPTPAGQAHRAKVDQMQLALVTAQGAQ